MIKIKIHYKKKLNKITSSILTVSDSEYSPRFEVEVDVE